MSNILLVEPDYRSKFPPLGLMKIATYHKERGDAVTFVRGKIASVKAWNWHRIYISSLFTYELPRTIATIKYYQASVPNAKEILVGGIGATLMPEYIKENVKCRVIAGPIDKPNILDPGSPPIDHYVPDYSIIDSVDWSYKPEDSYFCKLTKGCIRKCPYCAVPKLEPEFGFCQSLKDQIKAVDRRYGERQNLVLMDNNVLAIDKLDKVVASIRSHGFDKDSRRNNKFRNVDFNQGIDARLITRDIAKMLSTICLSPIRLAFDKDHIEPAYKKAIKVLYNQGFSEFTNYVMFNCDDTPLSFYNRLRVNVDLSNEYGIRVSGFPMRFIPITDVDRRYVSPDWRWKFLRGIQCVLLATHGLVSPKESFFEAAFGKNYEDFLEIVSMPERYIICRDDFKTSEAKAWRRLFRKLSQNEKEQLYSILESLNKSRSKKQDMEAYPQFWKILEHYYPNGSCPKVEYSPKNHRRR